MHDLDKILGVKNNTVAVTAVSKTVSKTFNHLVVKYFFLIKLSSKLT
jgi:hypothetical protein